MGILWESSLFAFLFVTLLLGGGGAWLAGRSAAAQWQPAYAATLWALPLTFAVRFIHYALAGGTLQSLHYGLVDLVILIALAQLGYRSERASQMATQYGWLYERTGRFGWSARGAEGLPSRALPRDS